MTTITAGSSKGGVGKTTALIILATELARMGHNVTMIDCDSLTRSMTRWSRKAPLPENIKFISEVSETGLAKLIDEHNKNGEILIVDLPGVMSRITKNALEKSDFLIVPMADSSIDAQVGSDVLKLVQREQQRLGKEIKHAVVFTQTAHRMSKEEGRIRKSLNANRIDIIDPPLHMRAAFKALNTWGGTLHDGEKGDGKMADENGLPGAKANAEAFVRSILKSLASEISHAR